MSVFSQRWFHALCAILAFSVFTGDLVADAVHDAAKMEGGRAAARGPGGEWHENEVLPYRSSWLDATAVLSGLAQEDRLADTTRDFVRCNAMVALAAAITGGKQAFAHLLAQTESRRASSSPDRAALALIRADFENESLTAADLHRLADAVYRGWVGRGSGASDGQIASMIRASGRTSRPLGTANARAAVSALRVGEGAFLDLDLNGDGTGWHVTWIWKDGAGVTRLYDSNIMPGSQVFRDGTSAFARYVDNESASIPLHESFATAKNSL